MKSPRVNRYLIIYVYTPTPSKALKIFLYMVLYTTLQLL